MHREYPGSVHVFEKPVAIVNNLRGYDRFDRDQLDRIVLPKVHVIFHSSFLSWRPRIDRSSSTSAYPRRSETSTLFEFHP
jgi:hypothetical protein